MTTLRIVGDRTVAVGREHRLMRSVPCRDDDEHLDEARQALGGVVLASQVRRDGADTAARVAESVVAAPDLEGYWLHVDVDVLDPTHLPAVDSPDPGGLIPMN